MLIRGWLNSAQLSLTSPSASPQSITLPFTPLSSCSFPKSFRALFCLKHQFNVKCVWNLPMATKGYKDGLKRDYCIASLILGRFVILVILKWKDKKFCPNFRMNILFNVLFFQDKYLLCCLMKKIYLLFWTKIWMLIKSDLSDSVLYLFSL